MTGTDTGKLQRGNMTGRAQRREAQQSQPNLSVDRALRKAERVLWQSQRADGSWDCAGYLGPWMTAQAMIALRYIDALSDEDAREYSRWLRGQRTGDGSYRLHAHAEKGDLGATACAWAALTVARVPENATAIAAAKEWMDARGGVKRVVRQLDVGDPAALYLAIAGLLDAKLLPCPNTALLALPKIKPLLKTRFNSGVLIGAFQLEVLVRRLRGDWGPDGNQRGALGWLACFQLEEALGEFQNDDGSWNDSVYFTVAALPALFAAGRRKTDPVLRRALTWLNTQKIYDSAGLRFDGFGTEVWSTAFNARALLHAGATMSDPELARAIEWLVDAQLDRPMPAFDNRQPGAKLTGGWAFQRTNHTMPDCDDAGVVLSTLGMALVQGAAPRLDAKVRASTERGADWLFGMQNPDGGWSAFVWGLPGKPPGPIMMTAPEVKLDDPLQLASLLISPPASAGDPSTEDLTSRVLHGLGQLGFHVGTPAIDRAVKFLQVQQCKSGAWWGRWVVNYLSSTAFVLMGLHAVRADMQALWVRRAVDWIKERQNEDGGFGEGPESYRDPRLAGVGASMPPLTGLVVQALIDCGEGESPVVKRAVEYLLATQRADGTWPNAGYLHTNIPPDTFYVYPEAARFYPTEALAKFLSVKKQPAVSTPPRWTDALLDSMRQQGDPVADAVVKDVFDARAVEGVNDMLSKLFRSDDPIPAGLPDAVRRYLEDTRKLPAWTDFGKLAVAQGLFSRAGWGVAVGLFCSSLPQAYCAAKGARVLTQTQGMTRHVRQRIFETAQFLFDVLDEESFGAKGRAIHTSQKVRLMHAAIRHLVVARPWDAQLLGVPINQEDLAGTLMTFSTVTLGALRRLGVTVSDAEAESWIHTWNVVGHLLGIRQELLPKDAADAELLMDTIRERQWAPSAEGPALARPLVELMQDHFPGRALDGMPVALIRYLAGDHCAELLRLPEADWTRYLIEAVGALDELVDDFEPPPDEAGRIVAQAAKLMMRGIVLAEREGKQAKFRIPESLRRSVDPKR